MAGGKAVDIVRKNGSISRHHQVHPTTITIPLLMKGVVRNTRASQLT